MTHTTHKIKIWLALSIGTAALVLASSASAMHNAADAGGALMPVSTAAPVADTTGGFDWAAGLIGAAVAAAVLVAAIAVVRLSRTRGPLAESH